MKFGYDEAGDLFSMKTVAAAIEFGTSKIVTLLAESSGISNLGCNIIGSGTVPYAGYIDAGWNEPEGLFDAIERSIRAAEKEAKRSIHDIYVGVPCENILVRTAVAEVDVQHADGRITPEDINNVMDAAADELQLAEMGNIVLHRSPAWFSVDNGEKHTMSPQNFRGSKLKALVSFIVADPGFVEDVRGILGELGITVNAFLAPTLGTALLLVPFDERDRMPVVLLDAGYLNTELSVVQGDGITYHAVLPMGGVDITMALSEALGIDMKKAEGIKRKYNFNSDDSDGNTDCELQYSDGTVINVPRKFVDSAVTNECREIVNMIQQTISHAAGCISNRSTIYLTGGGLKMDGCKEFLSAELERAIKLPPSRIRRLNHPKFASSLGLIDLVFDIAGRWSTAGKSADAENGSAAGGFTKIFRGQQTK